MEWLLDKNINCLDQDDSNKDNNLEEINKIRLGKIPKSWQQTPTRNYYSRPTPPDMQYEERIQFGDQKQYSADKIYEWNIDGRSEREIVIVLEQILLAVQPEFEH